MNDTAFAPTIGRPKEWTSATEQRLQLLEGEVQMLHKKLGAAYRRIAELEGRNPQLALDELLEELRATEAERQRLTQERVEAEKARKAAKKAGKRKKPQRGHGPRTQDNLPQVEETFELPEAERACDVCGGTMVEMGEQFEESEDIHVIDRRYVKRTIKRRKYRCSCNACVKTAPGPLRVIPGGRYSTDFTLQVAGDKYLDHTPLERQVRIVDRYGLEVSSQTLFDQVWALSQVLLPIYDDLGRKVLCEAIVHADETRWPRLDKKKAKNWTVWTRTTPDIAHYAILGSRSKAAADQLFKGYEGTVVVDGYAVYECLARDAPNLNLANCWAHVLRKFLEIRDNFPTQCDRVLHLIGELYKVEKEVESPFPGDAEAQRERQRLRTEKSKAITQKIYEWACTEGGLPKSELGKAVRYMLKRWKALTRFLENPCIPLDNNAAERSLRGPVVGRKVHYGSKSKRGTQVAAIFYTLFETAKLCGVEPMAYLRAATRVALESPGQVLLPHDLI